MNNIVKFIISVLIVFGITFLTTEKFFILSAIIAMLPTFTIIAHYNSFDNLSRSSIKEIVLFAMISIIPYIIYLGLLYYLSDKLEGKSALYIALGVWVILTTIQLLIWQNYFGIVK